MRFRSAATPVRIPKRTTKPSDVIPASHRNNAKDRLPKEEASNDLLNSHLCIEMNIIIKKETGERFPNHPSVSRFTY